jgi:hypothetical protein
MSENCLLYYVSGAIHMIYFIFEEGHKFGGNHDSRIYCLRIQQNITVKKSLKASLKVNHND